jgi:hypothetical protein
LAPRRPLPIHPGIAECPEGGGRSPRLSATPRRPRLGPFRWSVHAAPSNDPSPSSPHHRGAAALWRHGCTLHAAWTGHHGKPRGTAAAVARRRCLSAACAHVGARSRARLEEVEGTAVALLRLAPAVFRVGTGDARSSLRGCTTALALGCNGCRMRRAHHSSSPSTRHAGLWDVQEACRRTFMLIIHARLRGAAGAAAGRRLRIFSWLLLLALWLILGWAGRPLEVGGRRTGTGRGQERDGTTPPHAHVRTASLSSHIHGFGRLIIYVLKNTYSIYIILYSYIEFYCSAVCCAFVLESRRVLSVVCNLNLSQKINEDESFVRIVCACWQSYALCGVGVAPQPPPARRSSSLLPALPPPSARLPHTLRAARARALARVARGGRACVGGV